MQGFPILNLYPIACRYQWLRALRRYFEAARLLRLRVGIPPGAWRLICCEYCVLCVVCCVLSARGLSVVSVVCCQLEVSATSWSLVQRSPTDWCVVVCDLETSWMRRLLDCSQRLTTVSRTSMDEEGCRARNKTKKLHCILKEILSYTNLSWKRVRKS